MAGLVIFRHYCGRRAGSVLALLLVAGAAALAAGSDATAAKGRDAAGSALLWSIYSPDMQFAQMFGRPMRLYDAHGSATHDEPSLREVLQAADIPGSNRVAKAALRDVQTALAQGPYSCATIAALRLPWIHIRSTERVAANGMTPAHCRLIGAIDRDIGVQIDLPEAAAWNGKFLMGGGSGFLGTFETSMRATGLSRGYAVAVTDTGHVKAADAGAGWAYRNPEALSNWGHRGTHLAQAGAKIVIQAYYKRPIIRSYFYGTSGSGRQAMMEAQRYPEDFDGIVASCPAYNWTTGMAITMAWTQQAMFETAEDQHTFHPVVPPAKVALLDNAVYAKCDALDGLQDDLISNPRACRFDPAVDLPQCAAGEDRPDCFTRKQIDAIDRVHRGPFNSRGQIWPGWAYGGESIMGEWLKGDREFGYVIGEAGTRLGDVTQAKVGARAPRDYANGHYALSNASLRYLVFGDPDYDLHQFNFESDLPALLTASAQIDADNPDLSAFRKRGGKLIIWNGWSDWAVSALAVADYYERVQRKMGGAGQVSDFARLFLLPGNGHCRRTDPARRTPSVGTPAELTEFFDALELWVEQGKAPDSILTRYRPPSSPAGGAVSPLHAGRTRPVCAYPKLAAYTGRGSIDDAANFTCRMPGRTTPATSRRP